MKGYLRSTLRVAGMVLAMACMAFCLVAFGGAAKAEAAERTAEEILADAVQIMKESASIGYCDHENYIKVALFHACMV